MNSAQHAENSATIFGGNPSDYLAIHETIDLNKTASFAVFGRFFLHHQDVGLKILESIFTPIETNDDRRVPVKVILLQHLIEDYDEVPDFKKWLTSFSNHAKIPQPVHEDQFLHLVSTDKILRDLKYTDIAKIHQIFNLKNFTDDSEILSHPAKYCIFANATGIHLAEKILGLQIGGQWTNEVLVHYVNARFNGVPTLMDYISCVQKQDWMLAPQDDERKDPKVTQMKLEKLKDPNRLFFFDFSPKYPSAEFGDPTKSELSKNENLNEKFNSDYGHQPGHCGGSGVFD